MTSANSSKDKSKLQGLPAENQQEIKKTLKKAESDSVANKAQQKERQPRVASDLAPIQNTHEVGTSGGDQREPDLKTSAKK